MNTTEALRLARPFAAEAIEHAETEADARRALDAIDAALSQEQMRQPDLQQPEAVQPVAPREPTEAMAKAGNAVRADGYAARDIWRAMWDAAAAQGGQPGDDRG